jgi:CRISPR-associated endoribonuclease Cas6
MRFKLTLQSVSSNPVIPINYQYPLSVVIYKIIARADKDYASFLHKLGYVVLSGLKGFKHFTLINNFFK